MIAHVQEAIRFTGYHAPVWKLVVYCIGALFTGGWLFLLAQWSLRVQLRLLYQQCQLQDAEFVLVKVQGSHLKLTWQSQGTF